MVLAFGVIGSKDSKATDLAIDPVAQRTPLWCWAAAAQMVLEHYGFPNLNPAGDFQCGVVGAQGGYCAANCALCLNSGGTTARIAAVMNQYVMLARQMTGFRNPDFRIGLAGILSPQQIIDSIDGDAPVLAGISPSGVPYPPGAGFSQHAVVIVGYDGDERNLSVIINDPYPYSPPMSAPYAHVGAKMLQPGQYWVPYRAFVGRLNYGNSITFKRGM